jgi:hypothetical protein
MPVTICWFQRQAGVYILKNISPLRGWGNYQTMSFGGKNGREREKWRKRKRLRKKGDRKRKKRGKKERKCEVKG